MKIKHTPLPWKLEEVCSTLSECEIWEDRFHESGDYEEKRIADDLTIEDAEFIVKACSSFYELKDVCGELISAIDLLVEKINEQKINNNIEVFKALEKSMFAVEHAHILFKKIK